MQFCQFSGPLSVFLWEVYGPFIDWVIRILVKSNNFGRVLITPLRIDLYIIPHILSSICNCYISCRARAVERV